MNSKGPRRHGHRVGDEEESVRSIKVENKCKQDLRTRAEMDDLNFTNQYSVYMEIHLTYILLDLTVFVLVSILKSFGK